MKKRTALVALDAGALMLLVPVIGLVLSMSVGHLAGPVLVGGFTAGVALMGWEAFNAFTV